MTLPLPLTVRLSTARTDRHIERDLRSLSFRSVDPGGFASAQFSLDRPLASSPDELKYFGDVYIYDARNGQTVWEGRIEDLGRSAGADGQIWDLAAIGPSAHASDDKFPYLPIDSEVGSRWNQSEYTGNPRSGSRADATDRDDNTPALRLQWDQGTTTTGVVPQSTVDMIYRAMYYAGYEIARVRVDAINGETNANVQNRIVTREAPSGSFTIADTSSFTTGGALLSASLGGSPAISAGHNVVSVRIQQTAGGGTLGGDTRWAEFWNMFVRATLRTKAGVDITSGYSQNYVTANQVVEDLLGRFLPLYDGANARVDTNAFQITHLAYPDGITAAEVFADLLEFEPGFTWEARESNPATGKYRFEWKPLPTAVRYEASVLDGYSGPGSAAELYNKALVHYVDWKGRDRTITVTQSVPELDAAGITRTLLVDLGSEISSAANAQRAGEQQLSEHLTPPNAGTLTVARPIYDHDLGRSVMPWEIRPGNLLRVQGVLPNLNSLNATNRDGVTVFRVVSVDYDTSSAAAQLELDSYAPSVARALAEGNKRRRR